MTKIYSVLTCIFEGYEQVREVQNPNPLVEYILVTDDPQLRSETWSIIVDSTLDKYTPYARSFYVRSHPFEYVNTNTMVWVDGSINILDDFTDELMLPFIYSDYEIGETLNVITNSAVGEVHRWGENEFHGYTQQHADRIISFFEMEQFDNGLVQNTIYLCKNTKLANTVNNRWWELLVRFGEYPEVDQQSMSLRSYCLWKYAYRSPKLLILSPTTLWCHYFDYCYHNTNISQYDAFKDIVFSSDSNFPYNWVYKFHDKYIQPKVLKQKHE